MHDITATGDVHHNIATPHSAVVRHLKEENQLRLAKNNTQQFSSKNKIAPYPKKCPNFLLCSIHLGLKKVFW